LKIVARCGRPDLATAYVAEFDDGKLAEFVEAVQPPLPIGEKWVLIVSSLFGCPVACRMCDAGGYYRGKMSAAEILGQIDFLVEKKFPAGAVPAKKFKIQFARVGEAALNAAVLDVLEALPERYSAPGLMPAVSTVAPAGADAFFERLRDVKRTRYPDGKFQLQFSIHTTDERLRDRLVPVKKWPTARVAAYGETFYEPGDRKITLNFALAEGAPLDARRLAELFDAEKFLVKLTPLNPTYTARRHGLRSHLEPTAPLEDNRVEGDLRAAGFDVIVSIGEVEENYIGSNCGQFLRARLAAREGLDGGYTYPVEACAGAGEGGGGEDGPPGEPK
jgi:23S rRNA (adenine2503-C2)-methyltransferase